MPKSVEEQWSTEEARKVIQTNRRHRFGRFDWLRDLNDFSESIRQETLNWLVEARLRDDPQPPAWIFLAIDYAETNGWPVPEFWMDSLITSVHLYQVWDNKYHHSLMPFGIAAAEWLEKRQQ